MQQYFCAPLEPAAAGSVLQWRDGNERRRSPRKGWPPPAPGEACGNCHKTEDFAITHEHIEPPLRNCAMCHTVHGALHDALLKAPAKKLCAECHD